MLSTGERKPAKYFIDLIERVTADDIVQVARTMLRSRPSVAALGDFKKLPEYEAIQEALLSEHGDIPKKKFTIFGG